MNTKKSVLIENQIREVILKDFAQLMDARESVYGKFILIAVGIEFLGACMDKQHLNATARSEIRFNSAITKLFPKPYHHFVKKESVPNFYLDFRCPIIHQFRCAPSIALYTNTQADFSGQKHLSYNSAGALILVAEDFYRDMASAGNKLISSL